LVEFGRGRGNYFFDSYSPDTAGSGHSGVGCPYVPNGSMFELNYLHKVLNVKQYFLNLTAYAYNATFRCTYPNSSIVRQHLITSTYSNSSGSIVEYRIPKIAGSWERMGYLGMDFGANSQYVGQTLTINCTNFTYFFPFGGGNMYVEEDSFTFTVRDREPFSAVATSGATIGNGSQEVIITYNITNTELYTADDVIIEIDAPEYAQFIGTRGELWGTARDMYRFEKTRFLAGEEELITLVARFDTNDAPDLTSINLTQGIRFKYTTCWELNAYNPTEYVQNIYDIGTGTVDMNVSSEIIEVIEYLNDIFNLTISINLTINQINSTVNHIETIVNVINTTTNETNAIVKAINETTTIILNQTTTIFDNTIIIMNDTSFIYDMLNCNGTNDSPNWFIVP